MLKRTVMILATSLAMTALSAQAATQGGYAETSKEAVEAFVTSVCAGDREGVIRQMSRVMQVGTQEFEIWLKRNSEECQRYGGIDKIEFTESRSEDNHKLVYHFGNGTTSSKQSMRTERQNGIHRVVTSDADICDIEGCME